MNHTCWQLSKSKMFQVKQQICNHFFKDCAIHEGNDHGSKKILLNNEAHQAIRRGVGKLANTVKITLGPCGKNVMLQKSYGAPIITKDGVTVAKEIELQDHFENIGAQLVKEVASRTSKVSGDGTTTATILAQSVFEEGLKNVVAGANPVQLRRGIEMAVSAIVVDLQRMSVPVKSKDQIRQVATCSSNNDAEIGRIMAKAMSNDYGD